MAFKKMYWGEYFEDGESNSNLDKRHSEELYKLYNLLRTIW